MEAKRRPATFAIPVACAVYGCTERGTAEAWDGGPEALYGAVFIDPSKSWGVGPADYSHPFDHAAFYCPRHRREQESRTEGP